MFENISITSLVIAVIGFVSIITFMFLSLTPNARDRLPNLHNKWLKVIITAVLIGITTIVLMIFIG